jgi:hypothetical protein
MAKLLIFKKSRVSVCRIMVVFLGPSHGQVKKKGGKLVAAYLLR